MDLKQLEYFIRVAELGSFTRASIVIDIAQPALSRQVRRLEVELRQNLLVRNGRGVVVTDAGKRLLEHGRGILHQVERATEDMNRSREALAGRVAVGLPPSVAGVLTVPLVRAARERLPEAALSITENLSTAMQESIVTGRLDVALLYNPQPSSDVDSETVLEEDLFLVSAAKGTGPTRRGAPLPLRQLADQPLVIPTRPNAIRMLVEAELAAIGRRPQIALEIDGVPAILALVADGAGHAVLSRNAVANAGRLQRYAIRPIVEPSLRTRLALAASSQRPVTRTQRAMGELLRELVQQHLAGRAEAQKR
ncbi:LysR family nitrogen assimilation transcriptional regulator [Variovorax boronicumulans]|uniref:LysR substrate-binding domain-containing protein n=1 Tax=Variovorax boronicumulans TaxID=436515 RepID=UPI002473055C|nr:LysR substrate-binding domain-containing protein [Variovorax boronicumulans]MDH6165382.1 LysR family nitrogen assimilation transcriptional regulator [Variovorax boronicumulans]